MIVTFEGRMGMGKTTCAVGLAYTEVIRREILISAIDCVLQGKSWDESITFLQEKYSVSNQYAASQLDTAIRIYEEEGEEAGRLPKRVISNTHLGFDYTHFEPGYFLEHLEDEELEDCILLLDEAYIYLDARSTSVKLNKLFTYFVVQTRKRGVDLYVCTHHYDVLDKRLRRAVDMRGTCRFNKGPLEEEKPVRKRRYNWATVTFRDLRTGEEKALRIYGPAFWPLFDTTERVPFMRKQVEVTL